MQLWTHHVGVRAVIFKEDSILLVRHVHIDRPAFWCFPGGSLELKEDLVGGLKRELIEETGIEIEPLAVLAVQEFKEEKLLEVIFHCRYLSGTLELGSDPDNSGPPVLVAARWVRLEDLRSLNIKPASLVPSLERGAEGLRGVDFYQVTNKGTPG